MIQWIETLFDRILLESKDGEWGVAKEAIGYKLCHVIRGTDFDKINNSIHELPKRWIPDHIVERKQLFPGDILLEAAGGTAKQSTGRSTLLTGKFFQLRSDLPVICASFSRFLRLKTDQYNPAFVYYYLQALYQIGYMAVFNIQHTGVSRFQYTSFKKHTVLKLPALPIQKKIAAILSAYDDLIENNKRRITLLEKMAEETYREWFVRFRFPGHETVTFVKGVPERWSITNLGSLADLTMGQSPKSEFYNQEGNGLPFNQGVGTYGNRFPNKVTYCSTNGRKAKMGDILFSVRAPVGRINIADCDMIIGRGLAAIRHKNNLNSYLYYLLKAAFSNEDIIGNGAIFNSVGKDELKNFKIFKPDQNLVIKFNKIAKTIDQQIYLLTSSLENLTKTRNLLLPRLISGKLSVENLAIQFPPSMQAEEELETREAAHA